MSHPNHNPNFPNLPNYNPNPNHYLQTLRNMYPVAHNPNPNANTNTNPLPNLATAHLNMIPTNNPSPAASPAPTTMPSPGSVIDESFPVDTPSLEPPLELHISAPTFIRGSNNRVQLPGPRTQSNHLASMMKLSINTAQPFITGDQDLDDEENEKMGRGPRGVKVTVECGVKIEGDGNVVAFKGLDGENAGEIVQEGATVEGKGKGKRARSEPVEMEQTANKIVKRETTDQGS